MNDTPQPPKNQAAVTLGRLGKGHHKRFSAEERERRRERMRQINAVRKSTANLPKVIGWTIGDGSGHEGYNVSDYFKGGKYLGPDSHGIEPIFENYKTTNERKDNEK